MNISIINGTLMWYYYICPREVWYMSHKILPDQFNEYIELGREIDEYYYNREIKKTLIDNKIQIDIIKKDNIIAEVKKSSRHEKSAVMQLAFYLYYLKHVKGIKKSGLLLFPEERKKLKVELTSELESEIEKAINDINKIIEMDKPPELQKIKFCSKCGYNEICWV